jgi:hypothetical protein
MDFKDGTTVCIFAISSKENWALEIKDKSVEKLSGLGSAAFFSAAEGTLKAASRRSRKGCDCGAPSASAEGARAADRGRAVLGARPSSPWRRAR